jgi:hypothetical protein
MGNEHPVTFLAIKFPAPVCCGQPMMTITEVHTRKNGDVETVLTFHCDLCKSKLRNIVRRGDSRQ